MLPSAILTVAPSSRRAPALVVTHVSRADAPATGHHLRVTLPDDEPDPRQTAAPAVSAPHRCRRFHL